MIIHDAGSVDILDKLLRLRHCVKRWDLRPQSWMGLNLQSQLMMTATTNLRTNNVNYGLICWLR